MPDTPPTYQANLHWIIFFIPLCIFIAGLALDYYLPEFYVPALFIMFFGACWLAMAAVTYSVCSLVIKPTQLILKTGLLVRQTVNIPLSKIESIDIRQPIMGSILNYGTLIITGTGGTRYSMDNLSSPLTCRRHIEVLLSNNRPA